MICHYCQVAGDVMSGRRSGIDVDVAALHASCLYPQSCTCQHDARDGWVRA